MLQAALLIALLLAPQQVLATSQVSGTIVKGESERPAPGIQVELLTQYGTAVSSADPTWTDADGRYRIEGIAPGAYRLRFTTGTQEFGFRLMTPVLDISSEDAVQARSGHGNPHVYNVFLSESTPISAYWLPGIALVRRLHDGETAPGTFKGVVLDAHSRLPVEGVRIAVREKDAPPSRADSSVTDESGVFTARLTGRVAARFSAEKEGYEPSVSESMAFFEPYAMIVNLRPTGSGLAVRGLPDAPTQPENLIRDGSGKVLSNIVRSHFGSPLARLTGVVSVSGRPRDGAHVALFRPGFASPFLFMDAKSSDAGQYTISGIETGRYDIRITSGSETWDIPGVAITPGTNTMDFSF